METFTLFKILIVLVLIIIGMIVIFLKEILSLINRRCFYLRNFMSENGGIFTIIFIFLFFIEQIALIIVVSYILNVPTEVQFIISLFALLVLTTATLEKFVLEKRYEYQKQQVINITYQNEEALTDLKQLSGDYQALYNKYNNLKKQR